MQRPANTVVIGAGVVGVASAYFLAAQGRSVTVIDQAAHIAAGASHANGGMLTPSLVDPWNAPGILWRLLRWVGDEHAPLLVRARTLPHLAGWGLAFLRNATEDRFAEAMRKNLRLSVYSLEMMARLRAAPGLSYDQNLRGSVKVFRDPAALETALRRSEILRASGVRLDVLDPAGVGRIEPALDVSGLAGGIHCPQDEAGDAQAFAAALAAEARGLGVTFRLGESVLSLEREGDCVTAVRTASGPFPAEAVVLCAGAWSPTLARPLGLRLPIQPVKGYSITLDADAWKGRPAIPVVDDALHAAVVPLAGRIRVAGTAELTGFDARLSQARIENLKRMLTAMFPSAAPHLATLPSRAWAGFRPVTPDGVPIIGRVGEGNLFLNTGHGHLGWTMAAGSGKLLADLVCDVAPEVDPSDFALRGAA